MGKILCLIPSTPCLFCYVLEFLLIFSKFNPRNPQIQSAAWSSINLLKTDQDGCLNQRKQNPGKSSATVETTFAAFSIGWEYCVGLV